MNPVFIERPLPKAGESQAEAEHRVEQLKRLRAEAEVEIGAIQKRISEHGEQALDDLARKDLDGWKERLTKLDAERTAIDKALVVSEHGPTPPETFVFQRGNPHAEPRAENRVEPSFPSVFKAAVPAISPAADGRSSGRRTALARWIASADNPLTARVITNRL